MPAGIKVETNSELSTNGQNYDISIFVQKLAGGGEQFSGKVSAYFNQAQLTLQGNLKDGGQINGGTITYPTTQIPAAGKTFKFSLSANQGVAYGIVHADCVDTATSAWNHDPTKFTTN